MKSYVVYIMSDRHRGAIYVGVTSDLQQRVSQHRLAIIEGFSQKYHVNRLVYFEDTTEVLAAIAREKHIKGWTRAKKVALIESMNPRWEDLSESWSAPTQPPDSFARTPHPVHQGRRRSE